MVLGKKKTLSLGNRYLRYIKEKEAEYFIQTAHHNEKYNEKLHKWIADYLSNGRIVEEPIIKHHYYMPTDSSIALGTFVEPPGETVPIFSDVGKPVYLFKIAEDNWTYNLGGRKGSVCIVPHGWGPKIDQVKGIIYNKSTNTLCFQCDDSKVVNYKVVSRERINDQLDKKIRNFSNGEEFLKKGKKFLKGQIITTLTPHYLYCQQYVGKVGDK